MKEVLEIKNVAKTYQAKNGELEAIRDVSFSVKDGEFVSIIGPSGCGKSTLLSIIAGLETRTAGEVIIDGESVNKISDKIGYMLQKDSLLEWRTIYNNVLFGLEIRKNRNEENKAYANELLKKYHLEEFKTWNATKSCFN